MIDPFNGCAFEKCNSTVVHRIVSLVKTTPEGLLQTTTMRRRGPVPTNTGTIPEP
jgi:hypothetical protein